ncbi:hypothetical protein [Methylobacterium marchantiae]|uniref:Lipoprotein n=1 Tax=Methylobacterium marchantiae TaxID=600331 RepID=A0ABW3X149_9HYPH|nr:hypothetical protein AIGOOFII_0976 [Methylobacterium marchantiae]
MLLRSRLTLILVLGCVALAGAGCGRRGALQAPDTRAPVPTGGLGLGGPVADATAVGEGDDLDPTAIAGTPQAIVEAPVQTTRGAKRGYTIPKKPFILDPLL